VYLPYVYLVKNKITGEFYYGSRTNNVKEKRTPDEDLWVYYFTSSANVKNRIKEYGKESFETSVIFCYEDYDVCYWYEQVLIREHKDSILCLNGTYLDPDSGTRKFSGHGRTPEDEAKRGAAISAAKQGKGNGHVGFIHSDKTKRKQAAQKGWKHSEEAKMKMRGRIRSGKHNKNIGNGLRNKPWSEARREAYLKGKKNDQSIKQED